MEGLGLRLTTALLAPRKVCSKNVQEVVENMQRPRCAYLDFRVFSFKVYGLRVGIVGHRVLQLRVRSLSLGDVC